MLSSEPGILFFAEGPQGAIELSASLVGLMLGILYVFDGWRRPLKIGAFKDSYRLVALLFIVAGAGTTLFGDLRMFSRNSDPERWPVFLSYIVGVLVGGGCVMALLVCAFSLWWLYCKWFYPANFPDLPIFPGLMLLHEGVDATVEKWKESVDAKSRAAEPRRSQARSKFLTDYLEHVTKAFARTEVYRGGRDPSRRAETQEIILEKMVLAVKGYCHSEGRGEQAEFYANYMHLKDAAGVYDPIHFAVGKPEDYKQVLTLEAQTSDKHSLGFTLGVDTVVANSLPGAPLTILTERPITVADVEKDLTFGTGIKSRDLKMQIKNYLLERDVRSFFCFTVVGSASAPRRRVPVGVSMVECSQSGVLHQEDRPTLIELIQPFRLLLAWTREIDPSVEPKPQETDSAVDPESH